MFFRFPVSTANVTAVILYYSSIKEGKSKQVSVVLVNGAKKIMPAPFPAPNSILLARAVTDSNSVLPPDSFITARLSSRLSLSLRTYNLVVVNILRTAPKPHQTRTLVFSFLAKTPPLVPPSANTPCIYVTSTRPRPLVLNKKCGHSVGPQAGTDWNGAPIH